MSGDKELNKLKKTLHLKKLLDFLNLYNHVVFYHSHKISNDHNSLLDHGKEVLFLVKSARLRKLIALKKSEEDKVQSLNHSNTINNHLQMDQKGIKVSLGNKSKIYYVRSLEETGHGVLACKRESANEKNHQAQHLLRLVTQGGPMGSTQLVGCDSLEDMQKCISKNHGQQGAAQNYICLGAIYNNFYLDNTDCLRLARLNAQSINLQLHKTINQGPRLLLQQLLWPLLLLHLSLCARVK